MTSINTVLESHKKIVHRFVDECWNGGSLPNVPELVSPHCRYHDPVFPHMMAGSETIQRHIQDCRRAFPDLKFTITDTIAERDEVVVHWTATGTQKGEFLGIPPTGHTAHVAGTSIYRIEQGRIVEQWSHWNLMSLMEQLGVRSIPVERAHVGWE